MSSNCSPVWQIKFKLDYVGEKYEWGNKESFVQQLFLVAFEGRWHFWEAEPFKSLTRNTFLFRFQNVPLLSYQLFIRLIRLACLCYIILFLNCFVTTHCHHGRINWTEHTTNLDGNLTRTQLTPGQGVVSPGCWTSSGLGVSCLVKPLKCKWNCHSNYPSGEAKSQSNKNF